MIQMMMKQKDTTIAGISLGNKLHGIAIISYGSLIHWHLHTFHGAWSEKKLHCIIERYDHYIKKYGVKRILIKVPPFTHHSTAISAVLQQLLQRFQYHGCIVEYKTKSQLRYYIPEVQNSTSLMQYVSNRFPILLQEQTKELNNKHPYQIKMFEAVLAAHIVQQALACVQRPEC